MKKVQPTSLIGRAWYQIQNHKIYAILGAALIVILILAWQLPKAIAKANPELPTVAVLVVNSDMLAHAQIREADISVVQMVKGYTPINAYESDEIIKVVNKYTTIPVKRGEVLTRSLVSDSKDSSNNSLSLYISKNHKGVYLKMTDVHSIPEGLKTGDLINIVTPDAKSNVNQLLQKIEVIDTRYSGDQTGLNSIALSLNDDQISVLTQALASKSYLEIVILPRDKVQSNSPLTK